MFYPSQQEQEEEQQMETLRFEIRHTAQNQATFPINPVNISPIPHTHLQNFDPQLF